MRRAHTALAVIALSLAPVGARPAEPAAAPAAQAATQPVASPGAASVIANAGFEARVFQLERNTPRSATGATPASISAGGILYGRTGEWRETISASAKYFVAAPLYGPEERCCTGALQPPDQSGIYSLAEVNLHLRQGKTMLSAGRQSIVTDRVLPGPRWFNRYDGGFIGLRDIRTLPLTYRAATAQGPAGDTVRWWGGYADQVKPIDQPRFAGFARSVGIDRDSSAAFAGAQWRPRGDDLLVQGAGYDIRQVFRAAFVDVDWYAQRSARSHLRIDAQFLVQGSTGDDLYQPARYAPLAAQPWTTWNWNAYVDARLESLTAYAMGGLTGSGAAITTPFSLGPSYLQQQLGENSSAGERTVIVGATWAFAAPANGLFVDASYGVRRQRHLGGAADRPLPDWNEFNVALVHFVPHEGPFRGARLRLRYARAWERGPIADAFGGATVDVDNRYWDVRADIAWNIPFLR